MVEPSSLSSGPAAIISGRSGLCQPEPPSRRGAAVILPRRLPPWKAPAYAKAPTAVSDASRPPSADANSSGGLSSIVHATLMPGVVVRDRPVFGPNPVRAGSLARTTFRVAAARAGFPSQPRVPSSPSMGPPTGSSLTDQGARPKMLWHDRRPARHSALVDIRRAGGGAGTTRPTTPLERHRFWSPPTASDRHQKSRAP